MAADRQDRGGRRFGNLAYSDDGPAVVLVRQMAGRDGQHQHGQELHQADEAELESTAGQGIDLPAYHHGRDLDSRR